MWAWLGRCWELDYVLPLSIFVASIRVVSLMCVWVLCPYSWVRDVFKVLWMFDASSCVSAFELLRGICVDCIWGGIGVG